MITDGDERSATCARSVVVLRLLGLQLRLQLLELDLVLRELDVEPDDGEQRGRDRDHRARGARCERADGA